MPVPDDEPRVGIFWSRDGKLFHLESSPLSRGVTTVISVDYAVGHYAAWFIMGRKGILNRLPKELRDEYDSIPRGRVVYLFAKESFVIYHGDDYSPGEHREILERLHLPEDRTLDEVDEHYNPLPDDFLF